MTYSTGNKTKLGQTIFSFKTNPWRWLTELQGDKTAFGNNNDLFVFAADIACLLNHLGICGFTDHTDQLLIISEMNKFTCFCSLTGDSFFEGYNCKGH